MLGAWVAVGGKRSFSRGRAHVGVLLAHGGYHFTSPHGTPFPFQEANYYGSLTQASTTSLGIGPDGRDVYVPLKDLLPMLDPNDIHFDGESKELLLIAKLLAYTVHCCS